VEVVVFGRTYISKQKSSRTDKEAKEVRPEGAQPCSSQFGHVPSSSTLWAHKVAPGDVQSLLVTSFRVRDLGSSRVVNKGESRVV